MSTSQFTPEQQEEAEVLRKQRLVEINSNAEPERAGLEAKYGQVWNTQQLSEDFSVMGFGAPFVVVKRKSDGVVGSLEFQHHPRFYFNFAEDKK
jgi:hypothetical protein